MSEGRLIADKYRLRTQLGRGAMGIVWAATNEATERPVAVKLVSLAHADADEKLRARMLREARACGRIVHKNVVEIFDAGQTPDGEPFLVMPLLEGETLSSLLRRVGPLSPARAVAIGRDIAKGLAAAHAAGIVHRDLKPGNVFLVDDEEGEGEPIAKILDFGISKLTVDNHPSETASGAVLGSPLYMSPEQARGRRDLDHRSDLWTFGVVLYEMLTATMPFDGDSAWVIVSRIMSGPIPSLTERAPHVPSWLGDVVARCLVRDVAHRIGSAEEILQLLRKGGTAERALPSEPPPPAWSEPQVSPRLLPEALPPPVDRRFTSTAPLLQPAVAADEQERRLSSLGVLMAIAMGLLIGAVVITGVVMTKTRRSASSETVAASASTVLPESPPPPPISASSSSLASVPTTSAPAVASSPSGSSHPTHAPPPAPRPTKRPPHTKPVKSSGLPFDDPG